MKIQGHYLGADRNSKLKSKTFKVSANVSTMKKPDDKLKKYPKFLKKCFKKQMFCFRSDVTRSYPTFPASAKGYPLISALLKINAHEFKQQGEEPNIKCRHDFMNGIR